MPISLLLAMFWMLKFASDRGFIQEKLIDVQYLKFLCLISVLKFYKETYIILHVDLSKKQYKIVLKSTDYKRFTWIQILTTIHYITLSNFLHLYVPLL